MCGVEYIYILRWNWMNDGWKSAKHTHTHICARYVEVHTQCTHSEIGRNNHIIYVLCVKMYKNGRNDESSSTRSYFITVPCMIIVCREHITALNSYLIWSDRIAGFLFSWQIIEYVILLPSWSECSSSDENPPICCRTMHAVWLFTPF